MIIERGKLRSAIYVVSTIGLLIAAISRRIFLRVPQLDWLLDQHDRLFDRVTAHKEKTL